MEKNDKINQTETNVCAWRTRLFVSAVPLKRVLFTKSSEKVFVCVSPKKNIASFVIPLNHTMNTKTPPAICQFINKVKNRDAMIWRNPLHPFMLV